MNELEISASVLAAVALPLVGVGPMLLRTLPAAVVGVAMVACAAIVWVLTRQPWAAAFTLCLGATVLFRHRWRRPRAGAARMPRTGFVGPRPDSEVDPA
jgi:hypothetical protein